MPLRSRENITTHGELATGLTEDEQRGLQEIKEAGKNPELAEVLDKIDFARIEHIFKNQLKKTGIPPEQINFIPKDRILHVPENLLNTSPAIYDHLKNYIEIDYKHLINAIKEEYDYEGIMDACKRAIADEEHSYTQEEVEKKVRHLLLLSAIIHEEGHATSKTECRGFDLPSTKEKEEHMRGRAGVATFDKYSKLSGSNTFVGEKTSYSLLEEGINETLAQQVLEEYLTKEHWKPQDEKIIRAFLTHTRETNPQGYIRYHEKQLIQTLTKKLAKESGVSEETVFGALARAHYEGHNLDDSELRALFEESGISNETMDKIRDAWDESDIGDAINALNKA